MYAQNPRGTSLPRNYSGNAFRYPPVRTEGEPLIGGTASEQALAGEARSEEPPQERLPDTTALGTEGEEPKATPPAEGGEGGTEGAEAEREAPPAPRSALSGLGGRGLGSEDLLLLGMLLLLGGGEGQSELMMCLLMLLFCG